MSSMTSINGLLVPMAIGVKNHCHYYTLVSENCSRCIFFSGDAMTASVLANGRPSHDWPPGSATSSVTSCSRCDDTFTGSTAHARSVRSSSLSATQATTTITQQTTNMSARELTMCVMELTCCMNSEMSEWNRSTCWQTDNRHNSSHRTCVNPPTPTAAIWIQLYSIVCQTGLSHHL